ncbi:GNAT family N-acetyltransferase [Vibrio cionasavignyae]|uniref:GNAT family N-acetyltransferase n=1 Tax=Vibrio cionasavignyae TaxID=2910252 RepID=UPI003D0A452F
MIMNIQSEVYGTEYIESESSLKSKVFLSPETCFVLVDNVEVVGYFISLPVRQGCFPLLNEVSGDAYTKTRNIHIHDMVITRSFSGNGYYRCFLEAFYQSLSALSYLTVSIVSVPQAIGFWRYLGFRRCQRSTYDLGGYGSDSSYMTLEVVQ